MISTKPVAHALTRMLSLGRSTKVFERPHLLAAKIEAYEDRAEDIYTQINHN
jgi:hypothetical protein